MPLPRYSDNGPVDHTIVPDVSKAKGKSVVVTGGANGMGEVFVRAFVKAGAFVTFGDVSERGKEIEREQNSSSTTCAFVKCDIRDWDQQSLMFKTAKAQSPSQSVDVVIANAGISRSSGDSLWTLDDPKGEPLKPDLNVVDVNLKGTFYTWKLAVYYFRQQPEAEERDRCFIITGSMVAYIDSPGNWEYTATKYGLRGFMKTVRRSSWEQGVRIVYVAPCWIKSAIRTAEYEAWLLERGIEFGELEDVATCMLRIACDKSINGRSLMITPRSIVKEGYQDIDREDYKDVAEDSYLRKVQASQLVIIEDRWTDDYKVRTRPQAPDNAHAWAAAVTDASGQWKPQKKGTASQSTVAMKDDEDFVVLARKGDGVYEQDEGRGNSGRAMKPTAGFNPIECADEVTVSQRDLERIKAFLSPSDFSSESSELHKHLSAHVPGTTQWVFENDRYQAWHDNPSVGLLWITAGAGTGKSVLSSDLIRVLREEDKDEGAGSVPVLFFFFRRTLPSNREAKSAVRDLLFQLIDHSPLLRRRLLGLLDSHGNVDNASFRDLWQEFLVGVRSMRKVYIVIDGLDEVRIGSKELSEAVLELANNNPATIKTVITSRLPPEVGPKGHHSSTTILQPSGRELQMSISTYVESRLESLPNGRFTERQRTGILNATATHEGAVFLHAKLLLDQLLGEQESNMESLESGLSRIPDGLQSMYESLLRRHAQLAGVNSRFQRLVLKCVAHSIRPLRLTELASLIKSTQTGGNISSIHDIKAAIQSCCGPLLEMGKDESLRVIHHSLVDFILQGDTHDTNQPELEEGDIRKSSSATVHRTLATLCLDYLMSGCLDYDSPIHGSRITLLANKKELEDPAQRYPFLHYAVHNWLEHCYYCDEYDEALFTKIDTFFDKKNRANQNWSNIYFLSNTEACAPAESSLPLHFASFHGMSSYGRHLLAQGHEPDCVNGDGSNPLIYAAAKGHLETVDVLLEYHASPTLRNTSMLCAIDCAITARHHQVLRRLLASCPEPFNLIDRVPHTRKYRYRTETFLIDSPLYLACKICDLDIMQALINHVEPRSTAAIAICWASQRHQGHLVLPALLQYPDIAANINMRDEYGNTALFIAAYLRHEDVVRLLCENGADGSVTSANWDMPGSGVVAKRQGDEALSPLHGLVRAASKARYRCLSEHCFPESLESIARMLVNAGCDVNARDHQGRTALFAWDSVNQKLPLIQVLLGCGADPNIRDQSGGTVLHAASYSKPNDHTASNVALLVSAGADVNAVRESDGRTPIMSDLDSLCTGAIQLVELGANPNHQDNDGNTVLHHFCRLEAWPGDDLLEWLRVADPTIRNKEGETCLHVFHNQEEKVSFTECIREFFRAGLDMEAQDYRGRTIFLSACARGEVGLIRALAILGANLRAVDFEGKTGLHLLATTSTLNDLDIKRTVFEELVLKGATWDQIDYLGNTALHDAAAWDTDSLEEASLPCRTLDCILDMVQDSRALVNTHNHEGSTALHFAAAITPRVNGYWEIPDDFSSRKVLTAIGRLLHRGADVNSTDHDGRAAAHTAAAVSELNLWELKLAGANLRQSSMSGETPLHAAACAGHSGTVRLLCKIYKDCGWSIDDPDSTGQTPLHHAARSANHEAVEILLRSGANPRARDALRKTPLHAAAESQRDVDPALDRCVQDFEVADPEGQVQSASDENAKSTPVRMRVSISTEDEVPGAEDTIRSLLRAGADPRAVDKSNATPFDVALLLGSHQVAACLAVPPANQSELPQPPVVTHYVTPFEIWIRGALAQKDHGQQPRASANAVPVSSLPSLLNWAIRLGDLGAVKLLLESGADPLVADGGGDDDDDDGEDYDEPSPLHTAVRWGLISIVQLLLDAVHNVEEVLLDLLWAALDRERSNLFVIELLVNFGIDMRSEDEDMASVVLNLAKGRHYWHVDALEYLRKQGVQLEIYDKQGQTPLHIAVLDKSPDPRFGAWKTEVLDVLLSHGVSVNVLSSKHNCTALHTACSSRHNESVVLMLLQAGADPSLGDHLPIFACVENLFPAGLMVLLAAGANPNVTNKLRPGPGRVADQIWTPLLLAACPTDAKLKSMAIDIRLEMMDLLLKHGADPRQQLGEGQTTTTTTVFHKIAARGGIIAPILAIPGIDLEARDHAGRTPLLLACECRDSRLRRIWDEGDEHNALELIREGANIHASDNDGSTALHMAARSGFVETVRRLVQLGASAAVRDVNGRTPLENALRLEDLIKLLGVVEALKEKEGQVIYKGEGPFDSDGKTPLHLLAPWMLEHYNMSSQLGTRHRTFTTEKNSNTIHETDPQSRCQRLYRDFCELGWSREARDKAGNTPIFDYVIGRKGFGTYTLPNPADMKEVLKSHDITAVNNDGDSLLHTIARRQANPAGRGAVDEGLFKCLLEMGLDPHRENYAGSSALDVAAACGNRRILGLFKEK